MPVFTMGRHDSHHLRPLDSLGHPSLTSHRQPCFGPCLHTTKLGHIGTEQPGIHAFLDRVNLELAKYVGEKRLFRRWTEDPFLGREPLLFDTLLASECVWHEGLGMDV